jgi:hypothetical protein
MHQYISLLGGYFQCTILNCCAKNWPKIRAFQDLGYQIRGAVILMESSKWSSELQESKIPTHYADSKMADPVNAWDLPIKPFLTLEI